MYPDMRVFNYRVAWFSLLCAGLLAGTLPNGCGWGRATPGITVYSGRNRHLLQPLIDQFTETTGITVSIRYGGTAELAATILEEGGNSPADIFFAQDAGALGALAGAGMLSPLPVAVLDRVDARFSSPEKLWVGISGRARVMVVNPDRVAPEARPAHIDDLHDPVWRDRVGWAPMNASFQSFVTALRVERGDEAARDWLRRMAANRPRAYARNTAIVNAVAAGEVDAGLVNHYYLHTMQREHGGRLRAENHIPPGGTLINVAGVGLLRSSRHRDVALEFVTFLLSEPAQRYFSDETFEYPLATGISPSPALPPLSDIPVPALDLSRLDDLDGTLKMLQELGIL